MAPTATALDTDMSPWGDGVVHYRTSDGRDLAVSVDAGVNALTTALINETLEAQGIPALDSGVHKVVVEPTVIIECGPNGEAITLDRWREYPPGTSHEDALRWAGFGIA
ncbi:DUF7572 family protein [Mycobacterium aquaticum]|nr:hypothetical protein [Mycobacterium aquaticum]